MSGPVTHDGEKFWFSWCLVCFPPLPSSDIPPTHTGTTDIAQVRILHKMRKGPTVSAGTGMSTTRTSWREPEKKRISPKNIRNARDIFGAYTQNGTELYYSSREKRLAVVVVLFVFLFWGFLLSRKSPSTGHRKEEKWKRQADEVMRKGHERMSVAPNFRLRYCPGAFVVR